MLGLGLRLGLILGDKDALNREESVEKGLWVRVIWKKGKMGEIGMERPIFPSLACLAVDNPTSKPRTLTFFYVMVELVFSF